MTKYLVFFLLTLILFSCQRQQKFDRAKWSEVADFMTFPNRKFMIDDLIKNYQIKGEKYNDIIKFLGEPQFTLDSTLQLIYYIDIDYGWDIDPVYTKSLLIAFDKDTVVESFEVQEWKK